MQALSRSKDRIQLKFTNTGKLYRAILDEVLNNKMHVEREEVERIFRACGRIFDVIVSEQSSIEIKIKSNLVNAILDYEKIEFPNDDESYTFADTSEKMKEDEIKKNKPSLETQLKVNERDFETIENIEKENNQEMETNITTDPSGGSGLTFNNIIGPDDCNKKDYEKTFSLDVDIKQKCDIKINEAMQQSNKDLVTRALSNNEIRYSLILEKIAVQTEAKILARYNI